MVHKYIIFYAGGDDEAAELCEVCAGGLDCEEVSLGEVCEECGATNIFEIASKPPLINLFQED